MLHLPSIRTTLWVVAGALALGGILFLLSGRPLSFFAPSPAPLSSPRAANLTPHVAGEAEVGLGSVAVEAVYFIPRDRQELKWDGWHEAVERTLEEMRA